MSKKFLPLYNSAKIIKIDRDFPKFLPQMHRHLFYGSQCISNIIIINIIRPVSDHSLTITVSEVQYAMLLLRNTKILPTKATE